MSTPSPQLQEALKAREEEGKPLLVAADIVEVATMAGLPRRLVEDKVYYVVELNKFMACAPHAPPSWKTTKPTTLTAYRRN
jgi:hypothetical protein